MPDFFSGIHAPREAQEVRGALLHHFRAQLDLEGGPAAIGGLHFGVHLQGGVVPVLEHDGIERLRMRAQVPHDERLEEEAEEAQVLEEARRPGLERWCGAQGGWSSTIMRRSRVARCSRAVSSLSAQSAPPASAARVAVEA